MVICGERGREANVKSHFCKHPTSANCSVQWNMTIEISAAAGLFTLQTHTPTQTNIQKVDLTRHGTTQLDFRVCLLGITVAAAGINDAYYDKSCYSNNEN